MSKRCIIPYNPELKALARHLRKNQTPAEARLWCKMRRKQLGVRFLRFNDLEIMRDIDNVLLAIDGWIEEHALC